MKLGVKYKKSLSYLHEAIKIKMEIKKAVITNAWKLDRMEIDKEAVSFVLNFLLILF